MMINIEHLLGTALDWAVAHCQQLPIRRDPMGFLNDSPDCTQAGYWIWEDSPNGAMWLIGDSYSPSTNWQQGGAIIELNKISLHVSNSEDESQWCAQMYYGPTPLIAAMRAYVASTVRANRIDIPDPIIERRG